MVSKKVIPEGTLVGNPDCKPLKSWMPDSLPGHIESNLRRHQYSRPRYRQTMFD